MTELIIENLIKKYGSHTVLDVKYLNLNQGIYWIKGGNGTGKTTFFRVISGQAPFAGNLTLNQINIRKTPIVYRSLISYAEAEPAFPDYISGSDLLNFHIDIRKASRKASEMITERFGMTGFMDQKIGSYSSGMLKKLSLICAFTGDSQLYILDEPLITIDTQAAVVLYDLIRDYHAEGKSFLLSSHQDLDKNHLSVNHTFYIKDRELISC